MTVDPDGVGHITRLSQLEALSNPIRTRILRKARRPVTVAELADLLNVPPTRLYYHVNLLVEEGMLEQVDERKSGARIEKIYLRTASNYQLGEGLAEAIGDSRKTAEAMAAVLFDPARAETEDAFERRFEGEDLIAGISRSVATLNSDNAKRLEKRLEELILDMKTADADEGDQTYSLTYAFVPIELEETINDR